MTDANLDFVGKRLRRIRQERKISIRELAENSGLTHAFISLVERNKTSPSVSSLKKLLTALDITLADFFSEAKTIENVRFYKKEELRELADGNLLSYRQVGADIEGANMLILHEKYAPGASTGEEPYHHNAQEGGIIIKGKLLLIVGNKSKVLSEGDAYYFDSNIPHKMENIFEEECIVVSAVTPPTF